MGVQNPLHVMGVVQVGIKVDKVQGCEATQSPNRRKRYGVITANNHWQGAPVHGFLHRPGQFGEVALNVRGKYGDIAAVSHGHAL